MTTFFDRLLENSHKMSPELVQELLDKYRNYATSTITKQGTILVMLILRQLASHEFENYIAQKYSARILYTSEVAPIMTVEVHPELVPELAGEEEVVKAYETPSIQPLFNPMSEVNKITLDEIKVALGVDKLHSMGYTGKGTNVALLDSGVDMNHELIRGHFKGAYSVVDDQSDPNYLKDELGHASHTGSILAAFAPDADLYSYKIFKSSEGDISQAMLALEVATKSGSKIINASWGATRYDPIDLLVDALYNKHGTVVVSAAGNLSDTGGVTSPARAEGAIAVGSVALKNPYPNKIASFSSRGPEIDIVAFGGSEDEVVQGAKVGGGFAYFRGTSQATPEVAGIAACLYPVFGASVRDRLIESAIDLGTPGPDPDSGFGLVNPLGALSGDLHWAKLYGERKNIPGQPTTNVEFPVWPILGVAAILAGIIVVGHNDTLYKQT